ncbi:hypothetical protein [Flavobacterium sp.]|uniref:hypothetical protein n=1 Tax=Flavobacterium sp. TaxID=239 RepID=UPI0038FBF60D
MKKVKNKETIINFISKKDNPDGSADFTFSYGKKFIEWFKFEKPDVRATKKNLSNFIIEILTRGIKNLK